MWRRSATRTVAALATGATLVGLLMAGQASAEPTEQPPASCALPSAGAAPERSEPGAQQLDPAAVRDAVGYAQTRLGVSVQVYRNNCLVGGSPPNPVTRNVPTNLFSSTKSVVSMAAGIAYGRGDLDLDAPIGDYLPEGPGWGDAAHRAITVRNLLQQAGGLKQAIASEAITTGNDVHIGRQALALPITHEPGTTFGYSQRTPDLVGFVVASAVGQNLQDFLQETLFDPLGIDRNDYFWLRDRSGNNYGYAHLFIPGEEFARLGLLMQNDGSWNGRQVIPADYVRQVSEPSAPNACYGLLFWTNRGDTCSSPELPRGQARDQQLVPGAPRDMYAMLGALNQSNFMIPSLNMTITWHGFPGPAAPSPQAVVGASADPQSDFFRILMRGVRDQDVPDPGPAALDLILPDLNPLAYLDPAVLGNGLGAGPYAPPGCTLFACPPDDLTAGPRGTVPDVAGADATAPANR